MASDRKICLWLCFGFGYVCWLRRWWTTGSVDLKSYVIWIAEYVNLQLWGLSGWWTFDHREFWVVDLRSYVMRIVRSVDFDQRNHWLYEVVGLIIPNIQCDSGKCLLLGSKSILAKSIAKITRELYHLQEWGRNVEIAPHTLSILGQKYVEQTLHISLRKGNKEIFVQTRFIRKNILSWGFSEKHRGFTK